MVGTHRLVTRFFGLTFLRSTRSKTSLSIQDFHSRCFASAGSPLGPCFCCFSTGCHTAFHHVSGLTVNSFGDWNRWSLHRGTTTAAHTTHGTAAKLQISCCSPFSVVTKQNDPGCGCILVCVWRHCPVLVIGQNIEVWVEHCPSRVMTPCTLHCWSRKSFSVLVIFVGGFILRAGTGRCSL